MKPPKVVLIVLNWNKPEDTAECLRSCLEIDYPNFEILLVDNHSTDNSVSLLKKEFSDLPIIVNGDNLGYAGGNNVGIREALARGAEHIFLLNNDITLDRGVLSELVAVADKNSNAGILAPRVMFYDDRSLVNSMGTSMDWFRLRPRIGEYGRRDEGQFTAEIKKDILIGCAILVRRETIKRIGMLEEKFFIFHEEADWCLRNLESGSDNVVAPRALIYHKESKTMRQFSLLTHYYSTRNILYLVERRANLFQRLQAAAGFFYLTLKHLAMLFAGTGSNKKMARAFFAGAADYFGRRMGKCQRSLG